MKSQKISPRECFGLATLTGAGIVLAGCAPAVAPAPTTQPSSSGATQAPAPRGPGLAGGSTLTLWDWDETSLKYYQSQIDRWNATNTGKPKLKSTVCSFRIRMGW